GAVGRIPVPVDGLAVAVRVRTVVRGQRRRLAAVVALDDARHADDPLAVVDVEQLDALRVAPDDADVAHAQPDHASAVGDQHHLVVREDLRDADHGAGLLGDLHGDDAAAAATLQTVLVELAALALTALGHREDLRARRQDVDRDDLVVVRQRDAAHAGGVAAHGAHVALGEADRLTVLRRQQDLLV